jgi:hypothetical protein
MILYVTPYDTGKNIGRYYNECMDLLPTDDDYCCFVDADAIFTTYDYGVRIEQNIVLNSECGLFTAVTNRVAAVEQVVKEAPTGNDYKEHRDFGLMVNGEVREWQTDALMSGVLILLRKREWKQVGGFMERGMLGVDNDIHRKFINHNLQVKVMKNVYLYHYYRNGNKDKKDHLR